MKKIFNGFLLVLSVFVLFAFSVQVTFAYSITAFGTTGSKPRGMVIDPSGNIYVANQLSNSVTKITPAGVSSILGTTDVEPWGITIDPDGNLYTANSTSKTVTKITPAGVSSLFAGTIDTPYDLIRDNDGNFYTQNDATVTKITPLGVPSTLGTTGLFPSEFLVDAGGNIFGANGGANTIYKLNQAGVTTLVGSTGADPEDIIMDADGNLYTANRDSNNITKTTQAGVSTVFGTTAVGSGPRNLVMDDAGNIYVSNIDNNTVSKITPAGVSTVIGTTGTNPWAIVLDSHNNVYVANRNSASVTKITNPTITEVTPVTTPTTNMTPDYVFNSNSAGTITYGGSCTSATGSAIVGDNTITFNTLPWGTYDDCTITVTDEFGPSNTLLVSEFTIGDQSSSGSYISGYEPTGTLITNPIDCKTGYLFSPTTGKSCGTSTSTTLKFTFTKNLKYLTIDNEVKELQKFLNTHGYILSTTGAGSLGFETNFFGSKTKAAVVKFQVANSLVGDAIVGPLTRGKINLLNL